MSEQKIEPKPGDLIWADRSRISLPYNHCGIYIGAGRVIHFASPEGCEVNPETAVIHETDYKNFCKGCPVKIIELNDSVSVEETIQRARMCVGERGYDLTTNNCDHFATWCKTGKHRSIQVNEIKAGLKELELGEIGGSIVKLVCEIHDIAETLKTPPRLDTVYPKTENEIAETIESNAYINEANPPVADDENDISSDCQIIEEYDGEAVKYDDTDEEEKLPPAKIAWYEKVANVLKGITYPVSVGLELLKKKIPILRPIPVLHIAAKVRNVIDNIVTNIKVFTGRITKEQAYEERMNNEAALAGSIIQRLQKTPIAETLKTVFGKVGSAVKHTVQQVVTRIVPAPVRHAIKTGAARIAGRIASGVKSFVQSAGAKVKGWVASLKSKVSGWFKR